MKEMIQETIEKNMFCLSDEMIIKNLTEAAEMLRSSQQCAAETHDLIDAIAWVPGALFAMEEAAEELKRRKEEKKQKFHEKKFSEMTSFSCLNGIK